MTTADRVSRARHRVLELIKQLGPSTARRIAEQLDTSDVAVRQHLTALEAAGMVTASPDAPRGEDARQCDGH